MRVIQVIHGVHNSSAGPSYSVERLAHWLAVLGHKSEVLSIAPPPTAWPGRARLRVFGNAVAVRSGVSISLLRECRRLAASQTILHDHSIWRFTNLFPLAVSGDSGARIFCSPRGSFSPWSMANKRWRKWPFWLALQRPALERVHCFHATGEQEAEYIRQLGFTQPIAVIANGVELPAPACVERRNEVLFLGRIAQEKGLDLLLPAWQELAGRFPGWRLRIVGPIDSAHAEAMRALADRLGMQRCEFTGELRGVAKAEAFWRARLFVLPSYSENFGMVVAEALAHGVPVITTTRTPWSDLAATGCGWCVEPELSAVKQAMYTALSLPSSHLESMGLVGRERIRSDYGWDGLARSMFEAYAWVQDGARGVRPACVRVD